METRPYSLAYSTGKWAGHVEQPWWLGHLLEQPWWLMGQLLGQPLMAGGTKARRMRAASQLLHTASFPYPHIVYIPDKCISGCGSPPDLFIFHISYFSYFAINIFSIFVIFSIFWNMAFQNIEVHHVHLYFIFICFYIFIFHIFIFFLFQNIGIHQVHLCFIFDVMGGAWSTSAPSTHGNALGVAMHAPQSLAIHGMDRKALSMLAVARSVSRGP